MPPYRLFRRTRSRDRPADAISTHAAGRPTGRIDTDPPAVEVSVHAIASGLPPEIAPPRWPTVTDPAENYPNLEIQLGVSAAGTVTFRAAEHLHATFAGTRDGGGYTDAETLAYSVIDQHLAAGSIVHTIGAGTIAGEPSSKFFDEASAAQYALNRRIAAMARGGHEGLDDSPAELYVFFNLANNLSAQRAKLSRTHFATLATTITDIVTIGRSIRSHAILVTDHADTADIPAMWLERCEAVALLGNPDPDMVRRFYPGGAATHALSVIDKAGTAGVRGRGVVAIRNPLETAGTVTAFQSFSTPKIL